AAALDDRPTVVSVMLANNEVGTVQPLAAVAALVAERAPRAVFHTDAVQAAAWLDVAAGAAGAALVAVSAHKFGGPKGVGALVVREGVTVEPVIHGGGQERDRRSGTYNVAGIVGMAAAMQETVSRRAETVARVRILRDRVADGLLTAIPDATETGDRANKIAGNCHLACAGVEPEPLPAPPGWAGAPPRSPPPCCGKPATPSSASPCGSGRVTSREPAVRWPRSTTPAASLSSWASTTGCSVSPRTSRPRSSSRTPQRMRP